MSAWDVVVNEAVAVTLAVAGGLIAWYWSPGLAMAVMLATSLASFAIDLSTRRWSNMGAEVTGWVVLGLAAAEMAMGASLVALVTWMP